MRNLNGSITEERRVDPEGNRLPLQAHAARALDRFVDLQTDDLAKAKFREGDEMRGVVRGLLFRLNPKFAPELAELVSNLAKQHADRLDTLLQFGFLDNTGRPKDGDMAPPDFERVLASFDLRELELAKGFREPTLLLQPDVPFGNLVQAIDAHPTMLRQIASYVNGDVFGNIDVSRQKIAAYRAYIVEGAQEMSVKEGDDTRATLGKRVEAWKAERVKTPKLQGMDRSKSAMLILESLKASKPVDVQTWTILDDDPAMSADCVPYSGWGGGRPGFGAGHPGGRSSGARFRSSVGGDVRIV